MSDLKYDIIEEIGVLSQSGDWRKEINIISWNGGNPKYDIRSWSSDRNKMGKGIVLSEEEMMELLKIMEVRE